MCGLYHERAPSPFTQIIITDSTPPEKEKKSHSSSKKSPKAEKLKKWNFEKKREKRKKAKMNSLSTSIDSVLDDDQVNFVAGDEHIRVHSVDLSGM